MDKVFVFGTLKEGFPNAHRNQGIRFADNFETKESFTLYLVGERYSPWLVRRQGKGRRVQGQVFSVSAAALAEMDKLERISEPEGYHRETIEVLCSTSGESFKVYVYLKNEAQLQGVEIRRELAAQYQLEHAILYSKRNG